MINTKEYNGMGGATDREKQKKAREKALIENQKNAELDPELVRLIIAKLGGRAGALHFIGELIPERFRGENNTYGDDLPRWMR